MAAERRTVKFGDDRPSDAVLDELLRAFAADDPSAGAGIDLDSPEVEALLTGDLSRPAPAVGATKTTDASAPAPAEPEPEPANPEPEPADPEPEPAAAPVDPLLDPASSRADDDHLPPAQDASASSRPALVSIVADDLPDAVYIEGDLDGDGAGASTTVFIDDGAADVGEIVGSAEAARATGIEPKLRERRIAVRRAEGRKRLRWVALGVVVVLLVVAGFAVLGSSLFAVDDVAVTGAMNSRGRALDEIVADLDGQAVLRVDTGELERRLEAIPWVEKARVTTDFPSSAAIDIKERQPTAAFQGADGKFRVIDVEGRVLDVVNGQPVEYLPVSTDSPPNLGAGEFAPNGFVAAGRLAQALTPLVRPLVESIVVAADGSDVRLLLEGGTEVMFGGGDLYLDKLVRLETVINNDPGDLPSRIDVSTDEVTTSAD